MSTSKDFLLLHGKQWREYIEDRDHEEFKVGRLEGSGVVEIEHLWLWCVLQPREPFGMLGTDEKGRFIAFDAYDDAQAEGLRHGGMVVPFQLTELLEATIRENTSFEVWADNGVVYELTPAIVNVGPIDDLPF